MEKHNTDTNKNLTVTYVCPMHPEIKSNSPGKCSKCGMDLVPLDQKTESADGSGCKHCNHDGNNTHHIHDDSTSIHSHHAESTHHSHGEGHSGHSGHEGHDHSSMMATPGAAKDFLKRFYIVTVLLIPLILTTDTVSKFIGIESLAIRPYIQFGVATIIFYFSLVFFEHAKHEIKAKKYGMMTLVSVAVGAGYVFSVLATFLPQLDAQFYVEISTLIWILLFGHYLEARSSMAAGDALSEVAKLLPKKAHLKVNGEIKDVDVTELKEADIVVVRSGEKVPADGEIVEGNANMDESLITGESKPVQKGVGNLVVSGSVCLDGVITVKISRVGENSTIGQIQKLIKEAQNSKPRIQKLADKAAGVLTFVALGVAVITLVIWSVIVGQPIVFGMTLAITVLVIACPHALGLAIPTVSTIATSMAVKNGLFIKDLSSLEVIKDVDYVVFDKTGTLTSGDFKVRNYEYMDNLKAASEALLGNSDANEDEIKHFIDLLVYALEAQSTHPIAVEIARYIKDKGLDETVEAKDYETVVGKGVKASVQGHEVTIGTKTFMEESGVFLCAQLSEKAQKWAEDGLTVVYVAIDKKHVLSITLGDEVKEEAIQAVNALHKLGIKVAMLTGDSEGVARAVSEKLGIDTYFAQVLPEDKFKHIKNLQVDGYTVMMVGDGINDAPALTQANVGVAIGGGTDVAVESGDVVLTRNNPYDVVKLVTLSKLVRRKMVENLAWALGYNVFAIPAAAGLFAPFGFFLSPGVGAFLMSLSSVIVVINAFRMRSASLTLDS